MEETVQHILYFNPVSTWRHMLRGQLLTSLFIWLFLFSLLHISICDTTTIINDNNNDNNNNNGLNKEENIKHADIKTQPDIKPENENIQTQPADQTDTGTVHIIEETTKEKMSSNDSPQKQSSSAEPDTQDPNEITRDEQPAVTDSLTAEVTNITGSGEDNLNETASQNITEPPITTEQPPVVPVTTAQPPVVPVTTALPPVVPATTEKPTLDPVTTEKPTPFPVTEHEVPSERHVVISDKIPPADPNMVQPLADGVDLSKHDMQDFENWRKEFLEKDPIVNGGNIKEVVVTKGVTLGNTVNKKLRNFASAECGAKILSSNPEAQQANFALNENRDKYMNQPCAARKWLIIELCELVQLRRLEMGNLELFSSTFKNFTVYITKTDNKNEKSWLKFGSFEAEDERQVQTFQLPDTHFFTSTVKIEFDAHHGKEHFCPITLIRLYGFAVDDDDDDTETVSAESAQTREEMKELESNKLINKTEHHSVNGLYDTSWMFISREECLRSYLSWSDVPSQCGGDVIVYNIENLVNKTIDSENNSINTQPQQQTVSTDNIKNQEINKEDSNITVRPVNSSSPTVDTPTITSSDEKSENIEQMEQLEVEELDDDLFPSLPVLPIPPTVAPGSDNQPPISDPSQSTDNQKPKPLERTDTTQQPAPTDLTTQQPESGDENINEQEYNDMASSYKGDTENDDSEDKINSLSVIRSKRLTPIGKLSNRVSELELNVSVTTKYLEEMTRKSKQQKDDLQYALNRTMRTLQNVTLKYDNLMIKYHELIAKTHQLTVMVEELQNQLNQTDSSPSLKTYIVLSVVMFLFTLTICCRRSKQKMMRQEIQEMLANMPTEPRIHTERRGSEGSLLERENCKSSTRLAKSLSTVELKRGHSEDDNHRKLADTETKSVKVHENQLLKKFGETDLIKRQSDYSQVERNDEDEVDGSQYGETPYEIIMPTIFRTYDSPNLKSNESHTSQQVHKRKKKNKHKAKFPLIDEAPTDQRQTLPDQPNQSHHLHRNNGAMKSDSINTINKNQNPSHPGIVSWLTAALK